VAGRTGAVTLSVGDISGAEATANRGIAGGYANLDGNALVPLALLPTQTADQLSVAVPLSSTDEALLRQSGTAVLRGTLANLQAFVLAGLPAYLQPVVSVSAPVTINASAGGSIVAVGAAGAVSIDAGATSDGWCTDIANTSSGIVTLTAINGGVVAAGGGLASLLPGRAVHIIRYTVAGTPTFQIIGGTPAPQISLNNVAGVLTGAVVMVTGNYVNTTITGLQYQLNGSAWTAASGATIGSGSFSFSISGLSAGSYTLAVRDASNASTFSSAASFTVASSNQIAVNTPAGVLSNQSVAVSGSYIGTPAAIQYAYDGGSGWQTLVSAPTGGLFNGLAPAPSVGSHTVKARFADASVTSAASGSFTVSGIPAITVAQPPNAAHLGSLAMSGTYAYDAPTGLQWSVNGTTWYAATTPTISGGNWSFSIPGLGDSYYVVQVRLTDSPSAVAATSPVAVGTAVYCTPAATTAVAGAALSVSCLSTTTDYHSLNWEFVGQSLSPADPEVAYNGGTLSASGNTWSGSIQVPALAGTYSIMVLDGGYNSPFTLPAITAMAASSPAISITPFAYYQAASGFTVTGYWGYSAPSGIDYSLGGTWYTDGTATINSNGTWSLAIPAKTAGYYGNFEVRRHDAPSAVTPGGAGVNLQ
jgi:hypothetical protein